MNVTEKSKMDILIIRFSKSGPIRPLDIFNLNYASAASTIGLLVTHIIVLMQFRAVETSNWRRKLVIRHPSRQ